MEKLTQKELDKIIKFHKIWLETKGRRGKRAVIIDKDLSGLMIEKADLRMADIRCSSMNNMNIRISKFNDANFNNVDLSNSYIYRCEFYCVSFSNIDIKNTLFSISDLRHSWLTDGTDLSKACLQGTNLHQAKINKTYYKLSDNSNDNTAVTYCVEDKLVSNGFCNEGKFVTLEEFKQWYEQKYCGSNNDNCNKKLKAHYSICIKWLEDIAAKL